MFSAVVECFLCLAITILPVVECMFSVYRYNNTASGGVYVFSAYSTDISIQPVVECM